MFDGLKQKLALKLTKTRAFTNGNVLLSYEPGREGGATPAVELSEHLFRRESGRMVAALTRIFGVHNLALAEDVVQDAFCRALEVWKVRGMPENPSAWLMATAKNRALDVVRRERTARTFAPEMGRLLETEWTIAPLVDEAFAAHTIHDEQLRMMFSCCHPRLSEDVQVALVLNILCGFGAHEIASAFLSGRAAIEKRISRGQEGARELPAAVRSGRRRVRVAPLGCPPRAVSALQRGLSRRVRRGGGAGRALRRSDAPDGAAAGIPGGGHAGHGRARRAHVPPCRAASGAARLGGRPALARRPGPIALGRRAAGGRARAARALGRRRGGDGLSHRGGDRRRPCERAERRGDRLAVDRLAVRPADGRSLRRRSWRSIARSPSPSATAPTGGSRSCTRLPNALGCPAIRSIPPRMGELELRRGNPRARADAFPGRARPGEKRDGASVSREAVAVLRRLLAPGS